MCVLAVACFDRAWNQHFLPVLRAHEAALDTTARPMHLRTAGGEESAIVICIVPLPQTAVEILADAVAVLDPLHACAAYPSRPSFNASACLDPDLATSLDPSHTDV